MTNVWGWLILVAVGGCSLPMVVMARCNARRFRETLMMPPLTLGGEPQVQRALPWEKRWQPWHRPDDPALGPIDLSRYADLAANKANARRVAAEILSVAAGAAIGALLPAFFNPDDGGWLVGVAMGVALAGTAGSNALRQRAVWWELVADAYDEQWRQVAKVRVPSLDRRRLAASRRRRQSTLGRYA